MCWPLRQLDKLMIWLARRAEGYVRVTGGLDFFPLSCPFISATIFVVCCCRCSIYFFLLLLSIFFICVFVLGRVNLFLIF